MKKFIAIPLLVLYLVAVSGMMVQIHFCGTKMSSWNVNEQKVSCCCKESSKVSENGLQYTGIKSKADDCCRDKTITLKIDQDQSRANDVQLQLQSLQMAAPQQFHTYALTDLPERPVTQVYQANAPPGLWQNIPLYKLHSRFTYYG
jgi:hypothetical protein